MNSPTPRTEQSRTEHNRIEQNRTERSGPFSLSTWSMYIYVWYLIANKYTFVFQKKENNANSQQQKFKYFWKGPKSELKSASNSYSAAVWLLWRLFVRNQNISHFWADSFFSSSIFRVPSFRQSPKDIFHTYPIDYKWAARLLTGRGE